MTDLVVVDREHARISPSSFARAEACTASVRLSASVPATASGPDALAGTAAHAVLERCLREGLDTFELGALDHVEVEGQQIQVDADMLDGVQICLDHVRGSPLFVGVLEVEAVLPLSFAGQYLGQAMWGHADVLRRDLPVAVLDYKNGFNQVPASAPQLGLYVLAAVLAETGGSLEPAGVDPDEVAGTAVVVQPNAGGDPVRDHAWTWAALQDLRNRVIDVLRRVKHADWTYQHGDHCRWCPAAGFCPHLAAVARDAALAHVTPTPELVATGEISAATLEEWLDLGEVLDHWVRKVNDVALDYLVHGGRLKNRKLVRKRTVRRWIDTSEEAVATSLKRLGISPYQEKLVTPAEAERRLPPAKKGEVAALAEKPIGDLTLARADDPKEAIDVGATLRMALESSVAAGFMVAAQQRQLAKGEQS